ncbi:MAG: hypothetical protein IKS56_07790 [Lachnospiraceae bacterium]|nr:hypothetical protein [Lachnospiraceae bacterium]
MYGTSGNYYYDEHDAKRDEYLKRQANVMGNKVMLLFKLTIFSIVMVLASIVVMLFIAVYTVMYGGSEQIVMYAAWGVAILAFIINLIYGGVVISMKEFDGKYLTSGILYILGQSLSLAKNILGEYESLSLYASLASLASSIVLLIALFFFVNAIKDDVASFNSYLSGSWEGFKKANITMVVITVIGVALAIILPGLGGFVLFIGALIAIIISIWQIVLLYKTGKSMLAFKEGF